MKAIFVRKAQNLDDLRAATVELINNGYQGDEYTVTREVQLGDKDFKILEDRLLEDQYFIQEDQGGINEQGEINCIRVINNLTGERLLINSEGYAYPRYTAIEK